MTQQSQGRAKAEKVVLLALSGAQVRQASPARDLCTSPWFTLARAYAESHACLWLLLSAKYGLVSPQQILPPYEASFSHMTARQRREWGKAIGEEARYRLPFSRQIVVLAGIKYIHCLLPHLKDLTEDVHTPLAGLTVGYQCGWLRCNTPVRQATQEP